MKELIDVVLPVSRISVGDIKKLSKDEIMALVDADIKATEDRLFLASMIPSDLFDTSLLSNEDQAKLSRAMYQNMVPKTSTITLTGDEEYKVPTSVSKVPTNYDVIQNMTLEELARELSLIATWDRKEVRKIKDHEYDFFRDWLRSHSLSTSSK